MSLRTRRWIGRVKVKRTKERSDPGEQGDRVYVHIHRNIQAHRERPRRAGGLGFATTEVRCGGLAMNKKRSSLHLLIRRGTEEADQSPPPLYALHVMNTRSTEQHASSLSPYVSTLKSKTPQIGTRGTRPPRGFASKKDTRRETAFSLSTPEC